MLIDDDDYQRRPFPLLGWAALFALWFLLGWFLAGCGGAVVDNACYEGMDAVAAKAAECGHPFGHEPRLYGLHARCDTQTQTAAMVAETRACTAEVRATP